MNSLYSKIFLVRRQQINYSLSFRKYLPPSFVYSKNKKPSSRNTTTNNYTYNNTQFN